MKDFSDFCKFIDEGYTSIAAGLRFASANLDDSALSQACAAALQN
jgi:hypothetical protein